jgi:large subunit ribosomal protein L35
MEREKTRRIMPKIKTNRAAAKRFKRLASGKFKRSHGYARHQMRTKTTKQKRKLRSGVIVTAADTPSLRRLLPNG